MSATGDKPDDPALAEDDKDWQLYNMRHDLAEQHNLAATEPEKFQELLQDWQAYSKKVGYIKGHGELRATLERIGPEEFYKYDPANILPAKKVDIKIQSTIE